MGITFCYLRIGGYATFIDGEIDDTSSAVIQRERRTAEARIGEAKQFWKGVGWIEGVRKRVDSVAVGFCGFGLLGYQKAHSNFGSWQKNRLIPLVESVVDFDVHPSGDGLVFLNSGRRLEGVFLHCVEGTFGEARFGAMDNTRVMWEAVLIYDEFEYAETTVLS
jgi:hypothetical protein